MLRRIFAILLCMALLMGLAGCGAKQEFYYEEPVEATSIAVPEATVPADGNPNDVTCQGSYSVSDAEITVSRDAVVATMDGANLTNGQLQIYYWLEVASYRLENHEVEPDFSQSLDTQICPIDSSVGSWQQYFLKQALATWHTHQALVFLGRDEGTPTEEEYKPDLEKRKEYMTGMPATEYLYQWSESYKPNRLHQAYLDGIPEMLSTMAVDNGFADNDAQAKAIAGVGAQGSDLVSYTHTANMAYMYFTEMGYHFEPTAEEIEAYYQEALSSEPIPEGKTVDIRHILLIPDDADIASDGSITASENDWANCEVRARDLVEKWQKRVRNTKYAQFAEGRVPEARFSEFAKEYSQDAGSRINGGLYVQLSQGQLAPELDAWCFDSSREAGDYEIIRSSAGYHIVFLRSINEHWFTNAEDQMLGHLYESLIMDAAGKYPMAVDYSAIKLGSAQDNGSFITADQLLYPDVAHERFPDLPLYLQQDYPDAPFGAYKLSTHGCGITTLAMVASYMADDELTPVEMAATYGYYCGERGSEIVMFDDTPAEMGFYAQGRSSSWSEMNEALKNGQVVVSLQWFGYWTRGGHYLAIIGMTDDDRYVVRDSNLLNYKRILKHAEDSHSRGSIAEAGQYYWIYDPKVTAIPACSRCGGGAEGAPETMLLSDYLCEKCLTATGRRANFLNGIAG